MIKNMMSSDQHKTEYNKCIISSDKDKIVCDKHMKNTNKYNSVCNSVISDECTTVRDTHDEQ